jgi:CheY-like chemotaxis protein
MALVLLVEDDASLRRTLGDLLALGGHEVVLAEDGEAGLRAYRRCRPDLVLSDVNMPRIDGPGLLRAIRAEEPARVPFVFLTGSTDERDVQNLGADAVWCKPMGARDLLSRVVDLAGAPLRQAV